jgi:threonine/homoserine/homoserine lactone efflux protein
MELQVLEMTVALILFLFPLAYSPGPGNMFFAANGARFGVRATMPAEAGYHIATWIVTVALGFGFAAAMQLYPAFFVLIKWAGSAYVLFLAWKLFRSGAAEGTEDARPAGFADGAILLLLNPKAYLIIVLMFTQFLVGAGAERTPAVLWISTVFTLNNLIAFVAWSAVGDRIGARFRDARQARRLNRIFGVILAVVAMWMLVR